MSGVTRHKSQLKGTDSTAKYGQVVIPWQQMLQKFTTTNATQGSVQFATGTAGSAKLAMNSSNLGGHMFASTDVINFLMPLPYDFDSAEAATLNIYTMAAADSLATKGEQFNYVARYTAGTPVSSGVAAGDKFGATFSSSGITQPTQWTVHTGQISGHLFKQSATVAASTFTEGDFINWKLTTGQSGSEGDYTIQCAVFKYVKDFD